MTNKEKMLCIVLSNPSLQAKYNYDAKNYKGFYEALSSRNPVVQAIAKIIYELDGSEDPSDQMKVYKTVFNYLNTNLY